MPEEVLKRFNFDVRVAKAWRVKSEDGQTEKYFVKAIASDTAVDYHGERFSEKAIDKMVDIIKTQNPATVILLPTHWDTFEIGKAVEAKKIDSAEHKDLKSLEVDIELDMEYPQAKSLYKEVEGGNPQKQLSVGGYLNPENDKPYYWEKKIFTADDGSETYEYVLVLDDLILDHIATTRKDHAANSRTGFLEAVAKSKIPKPAGKEENKMSKSEEAANGLIESIGKSIKDFFRSTDANAQAVKQAEEALKSLKGQEIPENLKEALKSLGFVNGEVAAKTSEKEEGGEEQNKNKSNEQESPAFDQASFKTDIMGDVQKSLESFGKSLGPEIASAMKSIIEPIAAKIDAIEKDVNGSKQLKGQEKEEPSKDKNKGKENEEGDGNMWSGFWKSAIPQSVLLDRQHNNKSEEA